MIKAQIDIEEITAEEIVGFTFIPFKVNRAAFDQWVENNDLRDCTIDDSDHTFKLDWKDYYGSNNFNRDLKTYLITRDAATGKIKNLPDLGNSFNKLLKSIK